MKYKIVADSCCDLTADMKNWQDFEIVPLTLEIGEYRIFDDESPLLFVFRDTVHNH